MRRAFHLRGGQRVMVERIDAWLAEHGFEVAGCADALDACTHLLRNTEQQPDLVFIGSDWFAPEDYEIVGYVREAWPTAGIVVYGQALDPQPFAAPDLCVYCASRSALRNLLDKTPEGLLKLLRQLAPRRGEKLVQPQLSLPTEQLGAPPPASRPQRAPQSGTPATKDGHEPGHATPSGLLTPEELAALLSDE